MRFKGAISGFAVAFAVAALVISACGGGGEKATQAPTAAATATAKPPAAATATPVPAPAATPTPQGPQPKYGGVLKSIMLGPATSLDMTATRGGGWHITIPMFNYLVQNRLPFDQGYKSGLGPDLAVSWTLSDDSKVYTFKLADGVTWHDGKAFAASDVVFSFKRIASDPSIPTAPFRSTMANIATYEAPDTKTVKLTLKNPSASFLAGLTSIGNLIYPEQAVQSILDFKPIGTGPYKFVSFSQNDRSVLARNPNYFKKDKAGNQLPYLDGLELYAITDAAAKIAAVRTGRADMMDMVTSVTETDYQTIVKDNAGLIGYPLNNGWLYWTFKNAPPFDNVNVRKAFSLALDRQQWDLLSNGGGGDPYVLYMDTASRWKVPVDEVKTFPGYRQPKDADIAEAKRLLKEAGFTLTSINVIVGTYPNQATAAAGIIRQNLGIDTKIDVQDRVAFTQTRTNKNFQILYDSNSAAIDDPSSVFPAWYRSDGNQNSTGFGDATVDQWIDRLESTFDQAARLKLAQDIQKRLANELF
ncbi:MAG: hypothetical protein HY261_09410, partial [Chloroflexi bacterium]|nr:hypothetical protein [Chloroflexota bacterium]